MRAFEVIAGSRQSTALLAVSLAAVAVVLGACTAPEQPPRAAVAEPPASEQSPPPAPAAAPPPAAANTQAASTPAGPPAVTVSANYEPPTDRVDSTGAFVPVNGKPTLVFVDAIW